MGAAEFSFAQLSTLLDDNYENAVSLIQEEINSIAKEAENPSDLNALKNRIKESKEIVSALFRLKEEDSASFLNLLNEYQTSVNNRLEIERQEKDKLLEENFNSLSKELNEIMDLPEKIDFKKVRTDLVAFQSKIRNLELKKSSLDEIMKSVQNAFNMISEVQEAERERYEMECSENYLNLKKQTENICNCCLQDNNFKKCRNDLIELQKQIKETKLKREQKDELYAQIRVTFNTINQKQDEERELFEKEAANNSIIIKTAVEEACNYASMTENFKEARETLIHMQERIKGLKLKRSDRDKFYADIRKVFNEVNARQNETKEDYDKECTDNYNVLKVNVEQAFVDAENLPEFKAIRDQLLAVQNDVKEATLRKDQRNELFKQLKDAFSILDRRRNAYIKEKESQRSERLSKALDDLISKKQKVKDSIEYDKESLKSIEEKIDNPENGNNIDELVERKSFLENKIKEKETRLEEIDLRVQDIEKNLKETA